MKAFGKLHPVTLLIYFVMMLAFSMFLRNPVTAGLSLLGSIAFCCTLTDRREKLEDLRFYLPLSALIVLTNPLVSHNGRTPLFFVNGNAFTLEAIWYGVFIAGMIAAVLLWSKAYSKIFTSDKFLYLFGRILPKTALILSVALRCVPLMKAQAARLKDAQKTLGLFSTGSVADNVVSTVKVYAALVAWSLENAVETGRHMKARGWNAGRRTAFSTFRFRVTDAVFIAVFAAAGVLLLLAAARGALYFSFYPAPTPLPADPVSVSAYALFGGLAFLPFFTETEESIRWTCLRSKI